jgi:hypothetical protein
MQVTWLAVGLALLAALGEAALHRPGTHECR